MTISFQALNNYNPKGICSICLEELGDVLKSINQEKVNFYHLRCLENTSNLPGVNLNRANFQESKDYDLFEKCNICAQNLDLVVAHDGLGKKHPFHKVCIEDWIKNHQVCPICNFGQKNSSVINIPIERIGTLVVSILSIIGMTYVIELVGNHFLSSLSLFQRGAVEFFSGFSLPLTVKLFAIYNFSMRELKVIQVLSILTGVYAAFGLSSGIIPMAISGGFLTTYSILGSQEFRENNSHITTKIAVITSIASLAIMSQTFIPSWQRVATSIISLSAFAMGISIFKIVR